MSLPTTYLGDSVYVSNANGLWKLATKNGRGVDTNVIWLDVPLMHKLIELVQVGRPEEPK